MSDAADFPHVEGEAAKRGGAVNDHHAGVAVHQLFQIFHEDFAAHIADDPDFHAVAPSQVLQDVGDGWVGQIGDHHIVSCGPFHHVVENEIGGNGGAVGVRHLVRVGVDERGAAADALIPFGEEKGVGRHIRGGDVLHAAMLNEIVELPNGRQPVIARHHLIRRVQIDPMIQEFEFVADFLQMPVYVVVIHGRHCTQGPGPAS